MTAVGGRLDVEPRLVRLVLAVREQERGAVGPRSRRVGEPGRVDEQGERDVRSEPLDGVRDKKGLSSRASWPRRPSKAPRRRPSRRGPPRRKTTLCRSTRRCRKCRSARGLPVSRWSWTLGGRRRRAPSALPSAALLAGPRPESFMSPTQLESGSAIARTLRSFNMAVVPRPSSAGSETEPRRTAARVVPPKRAPP